MRDDQEFNIRFVRLVEVRPCLYDNTREDYNLSHVQERAWAEIAEQMNATVADCKGRWKNLRGSYTKHLKKYTTSGSQGSNLRPYYLAKHLQFIHPFTKSRSSKGNIVPPPTYEQITISSHHPNDDYAEALDGTTQIIDERTDEKDGWAVVDHVADDESTSEMYQNSPQDLVETVYAEDPPSAAIRFDKKKRKVENSSGQLAEHKLLETPNKSRLQTIFECLENKRIQDVQKMQPPAPIAEVDADVHFLFSLLPDLRKMTDRQKRRFKVEILNLAGEILEET